jgi:hypothetical protein
VKPAEMLEGRILDGGWTVGKRIQLGPDSTGGHFSVSYAVTAKSGNAAFLKALDYSEAFASGDPARSVSEYSTVNR